MAKDAFPISVTSLMAEGYSADGGNVIISLTTKYSGAERKYSVPVERLYDFVVGLRRLAAQRDRGPIETSIETTVAPDVEDDVTVTLPTAGGYRTRAV